jgi:large subunit ribosomal protein L29
LKASEVRGLNVDDVTRKLAEAREELFNLRFQHATGALENTARIAAVRRDVARLLTIQRESAEETTDG